MIFCYLIVSDGCSSHVVRVLEALIAGECRVLGVLLHFFISSPINYREVMFVSVVVGGVIAVSTLRSILKPTYAICFGSVKGGNVPERDDLHVRGLNVIGGDYWEVSVLGFLFVAT